MAAESKVQKVARGAARMPKSPGKGKCGHEILWVIYAPQTGQPRMRKYCETCYAWDGKEEGK